MTIIVDASALLAVLLDEPGAAMVVPVLRGSAMSALNASETFSRIVDNGAPASVVSDIIAGFEIDIAAFDLDQAMRAAELRPLTKRVGASLGDRACLALALTRRGMMLTGDRRLAELDLGIEIRLIR